MFGYIIVNRQELKIKEYEMYRSFYCGLCQELKERYGKKGQMTLTYDLTFLVMLLTDLYQDEPKQDTCRCIAHPLEKHPMLTSRFTGYAADMNVLMSYYQCLDDWEDEHKATKKAASVALGHAYKHLCSKYPEKVETIEKWMVQLHTYEKNNTGDIDEAAGCFGQIMAEVFAVRHDEWESELRTMGFFLGKFIYLMDAYEDLEEDEKNNRYNPLLSIWHEDGFEERADQILTMMLAAACKSFERLPLVDYASILSNILYSGVWSRYEMTNQKRKDSKDHV